MKRVRSVLFVAHVREESTWSAIGPTTNMTDDEFPLPAGYDVKAVADPFAQFPSEHVEQSALGLSVEPITTAAELSTSPASPARTQSVTLFSFASEEARDGAAPSPAPHNFVWEHASETSPIATLPIAPSTIEPPSAAANVVPARVREPRVRRAWWPPVRAAVLAFMAGCASVARSVLQWLSAHTWNATVAVIGFVCAVLIVAARLFFILIRRNAPRVRQGASASAMFTARCAALFARLCSSAAVLGLTLARRTYALLLQSFPVVGASATRHYAYPAVFMSGVAVGVLVMVGRAPSDPAGAFPAAASARTDVALVADVLSRPASQQAPGVDNPVPTSGVDAARQNARGVARVAAAAPRQVANPPAAQARGVSRTPANSRAPGRGRSRTPARAVPASEPDDDTPGPGAFRGSVAVGSRPEGAEVFVNGQSVGRTPLVLNDLPIGSRAVRLTLDGHQPWSRAVQVVANQRTTVTATLQRSGSN